MAESVKVAVRVRPFNAREKERHATLIIDMINNTTEIKDPDNPKDEPRRFTFDYSYWSHDGYSERDDGYLEPKGNKYADQKRVFDDLGRGVLANAWNGYNCSLFAYGQTGSGKSYSMVGYGNNKGIVPISCEELFKGIEEKRRNAGAGEDYQVTFSMMEIYNEQVRDLLNPQSLKIKGGLKVRQHPNKGFYVEALKNVNVNSYAEIDGKMEEGTKNRTVASTAMNATSSRAHTIVAINFSQKEQNEAGQSMTKSAIINLVDLAGSERAESTGATGDRLKEGSAINQSLSTLGNCIKALAELSQGKKGTLGRRKKTVIMPFRDSVLTKLLKNALGGNSKTVMIAALSPADINYEETLSTLRFADRAKAIKTKAVINESPTDKLIRELREENARLLKAIKAGGGQLPSDYLGGAGLEGNTSEEIEEMKKEMEEQLRKNQEEIEMMNQTWEQKMREREDEFMAEQQAKRDMEEKKKVMPHLWNLNEDASLSSMIIHFVPQGKTTIGSQKADPLPGIVLSGLGIQPEHASLVNKKGKVTFVPQKGVKVLLNGNEIVEKKELCHNDRLMFGSNTLFVFHHPQDATLYEKKNKKPMLKPTYETAQMEIAENSGLNKLAGSGRSKEDLLLQEDLVQIWPMITEANTMSEELDKMCKFEIALVSPQTMGKKHGHTEVCVKMKNLKNNNEYMWDRNKFINRKFLMTEMYQNFASGDKDWDVPQESDPFWEEPSQEVLIGTVHVYLQSLAHYIDFVEDFTISDIRGVGQGCLHVELWPCDQSGVLIEDECVDEPEEMIGQELNFKVIITYARGLPNKYESTFCTYKMYLNDKPEKTEEIKGTINPEYKHEKIFTFNPATKQFVTYLTEEPLIVKVWGRQKSVEVNTTLNTRELLNREKTLLGRGSAKEEEVKKIISEEDLAELQYRMSVEANTYRRRYERAEVKLGKIQKLMSDARNSKQAAVSVSELERVLSGGVRLKAVANIIAQAQKAKKNADGNASSQACVIQ